MHHRNDNRHGRRTVKKQRSSRQQQLREFQLWTFAIQSVVSIATQAILIAIGLILFGAGLMRIAFLLG